MDYKSRQWRFAAAYSQALRARAVRPAKHNPETQVGDAPNKAVAAPPHKMGKMPQKIG